MGKVFELTFGRRGIGLERSETEIAVRPHARLRTTFDNQLRDLTERHSVNSRARIGGYEIMKISAPPRTVARETRSLAARGTAGDVTPIYYTSADRVPFVPPGTIYLAFEPGVSDARKQEIISKHGFLVARAEKDGALTVYVGRKGADAVEVAANLQKEPGVRIAEPDLITPKEKMQLPADELIDREWHLNNIGHLDGVTTGFKQGADARVVAAWTAMNNLGSPDAVIGIIDDGFDLDHPDLAGKAVKPWDFYGGTDECAQSRTLKSIGLATGTAQPAPASPAAVRIRARSSGRRRCRN